MTTMSQLPRQISDENILANLQAVGYTDIQISQIDGLRRHNECEDLSIFLRINRDAWAFFYNVFYWNCTNVTNLDVLVKAKLPEQLCDDLIDDIFDYTCHLTYYTNTIMTETKTYYVANNVLTEILKIRNHHHKKMYE